MGCPRARVLRRGGLELQQHEDAGRRLGRAVPEPRGSERGRHLEGRSRVLRHDRRRERLVGSEPPREVQRQDVDRGRPHRRNVRRQRLLLVGAVQRQRRKPDLLRPLHRSRRPLQPADPARGGAEEPAVPRHLGDAERPRLRDVPHVHRRRTHEGRDLRRQVEELRQDVLDAAPDRHVHPVRRRGPELAAARSHPVRQGRPELR